MTIADTVPTIIPSTEWQQLTWWKWITAETDRRPWLLLGKGPTFCRVKRVDLHKYNLLGLNHVCREQAVDVTHIIDLEVLADVPLDNLLACECVVMPWRPHLDNTVDGRCLPELVAAGSKPAAPHCLQALAAIHEAGLLRWYNLAPGGEPHDPPESHGRPVGVRYFSGEAAANLLLAAGRRELCTLGIDGGKSYASDFGDLTPLANGRKNFDQQITELRKIAAANKATITPLASPERFLWSDNLEPLDQVFTLQESRQLHAIELGPYNGRITARCAHRFASVLSLEPRPENVERVQDVIHELDLAVNTSVEQHTLESWLESEESINRLRPYDKAIVISSGVLYHLPNPVHHLWLCRNIWGKLYLNTHVARVARETLESGECWEGEWHAEPIHAPRAGLESRSFWLTYEELERALHAAGYKSIRLLRDRQEPNGRRVALYCE